MTRIYRQGTTVRLSPHQPDGVDWYQRYPNMRGTVVDATLGMTMVQWGNGELVTHYNREIVRCNRKRAKEAA